MGPNYAGGSPIRQQCCSRWSLKRPPKGSRKRFLATIAQPRFCILFVDPPSRELKTRTTSESTPTVPKLVCVANASRVTCAKVYTCRRALPDMPSTSSTSSIGTSAARHLPSPCSCSMCPRPRAPGPSLGPSLGPGPPPPEQSRLRPAGEIAFTSIVPMHKRSSKIYSLMGLSPPSHDVTSSARWLVRTHVSGTLKKRSFLRFVVFPLRIDNFAVGINEGGR